jgi:transketolase
VTDPNILRLLAVMTGDEKHKPASYSTLDVIEVLYQDILRIDPSQPDDPHRDRFLLSKGHGPMAYYAVLAHHKFFAEDWLLDWGTFDSPLGFHPDRNLIPGVEISSGSLGHGLPIAVGLALGLRNTSMDARVITLVGDAELDEGSNAEAITLAKALNLNRFTVVAIDNASASYRIPGLLERRFEVEGWHTRRVDGHNQKLLADAFKHLEPGPNLVVAEVL